AKKAAGGATSDEEGTDGEMGTENEADGPSLPRPRLKRKTRATAAEAQEEPPVEEQEPATPKARRHPKRTNEKPPEPADAEPATQSPVQGMVDKNSATNGLETPKASRKRARPDDEDEEMQEAEAALTVEITPSDTAPQPTPPADDGEIQIRRKRVRH
ncbi:hypothetical protein C0991_011216, partial [Blastosporella zonata]